MIEKLRNFIMDKEVTLKKKIGGKEVIMEFALGAIAVVLAVVFREQLEAVITTVGKTFSEKITSLFQGM